MRTVVSTMSWQVLTLAVAVIVLPVTVSASSAATGGTSRIVIHTTGEIEGIALDGQRLAYSRDANAPRCAAIIVVDLTTGKKAVVSGGGRWPACDVDSTGELALAGSRVVWLSAGESNSEAWSDLLEVSPPRRKEHRLASSRTYFNPLPATGEVLADLVGGGELLVVNRWQVKKKGDPGRTVLYAIGPTGLRRILDSPQPFFAQSVDRGRIAVQRGSRAEIYDTHGQRQLAVDADRLPVSNYRGDGIALQGDHLLVLSGKRVLDYDSHTGALRHSWPVKGAAINLDTYGGLAVYATWTKFSEAPFTLHVLRLSTGRDVALDRGFFQTLRNLELGPSGLVYVKGKRTLVFVPLSRLRAAVAG